MARSVRRDASNEALSFARKGLRTYSYLAGMLLLCLFSIGCNNGRQLQTDLYQRELRLQEDKIYQLQDCVDEYQAIIRGYRMEVAELKASDSYSAKATASKKPATKSSPKILPLNRSTAGDASLPELEFRAPSDSKSILEKAPNSNEEAPLFKPDTFEPSTESLPTPNELLDEAIEEAPLFVPQSYEKTQADSPLLILSTIEEESAIGEEIAAKSQFTEPFTEPNYAELSNSDTIDMQIEQSGIVQAEMEPPNATPELSNLSSTYPTTQADEPLKPLKSLGRGFILSAREEVGLELRNGSPATTGDATLLATLHLFSESFDLSQFQGELSFMLADQIIAGKPNRIARWDFTASEVQQAWQLQEQASQVARKEGSLKSTKIELPLLLPKRLPTDRTLEMWVRVVEPSGKKRLTKIDAEFLSNPLRLINAEPLAKDDASSASKQAKVTQALAEDLRQVPQNQWRSARANRSEATSSEIQQVTFEEPRISSLAK